MFNNIHINVLMLVPIHVCVRVVGWVLVFVFGNSQLTNISRVNVKLHSCNSTELVFCNVIFQAEDIFSMFRFIFYFNVNTFRGLVVLN